METAVYKTIVFKTDVTSAMDAEILLQSIKQQYPNHLIFFDLTQSEPLLWVEGWNIAAAIVTTVVKCHGFHCEVLKD